MTTHEILSNICRRMDALAAKGIIKAQNEIQALSRTVSENTEALEGRVFEVEAKNDQLQKEIGALKKENQTMKDTLNCLLYTSPSPRDIRTSRMPSSA